jgi:hypothetical protein
MDPSLLPQRFGGGGMSNVHPAVMIAYVLVAGLIFVLPRKYVIPVFLAATLLIPMDQGLVIGMLHFQATRILITLGWIRLLATRLSSKGSFLPCGLTMIDKMVILYASFNALDFVLLWRELDAVINQLGLLYTILGTYFLLRYFIRNEEDVLRTIRTFAYVAVSLAVMMTSEFTTQHSAYAFLGGEMRSHLLRREHGIRAMASFQHPITAGAFGAISFPLFVGLWWKRNRFAAVIGNIASVVIVITSTSSTGVSAYAAGIIAFCFWPLRRRMRAVRRGIVACLITLHLIMKAPVWALIGHMDIIGGSDSWHREYVVDQFIRRFFDWWLLGTKDNYNWGWDMWDITNQYVAIGFTGGVLAFAFFVGIIVYCFKYLGRARRVAQGNKGNERFLWALGSALFANAAAFFGVIYFDQVGVAWYSLLVIVCVTTQMALGPKPHAMKQTENSHISHPQLLPSDIPVYVERRLAF